MKHSILMMISSFLPLALVSLFAEKNALLAQAQTGGLRMGEPPAGQPQMGQPQTGEPEMGEPPAGQPQMGQRTGPAVSIQGLDTVALPAEAVSENEMPDIQSSIEQVLARISESGTSSGNPADYQTIESSLLAFQNWLKAQGCVADASSPYDIEKTDAYDENIFLTHPGQIPFDIVFRMVGGAEQAYRLLLFVTKYELFNFGSLMKNNAKEEVYIPERWPQDAPGYWESRS